MIDSIIVGNRKLVLNDQQLADALMDDYVMKEKYKQNPNKREAEKTTYIMHV